jgi:processive 1,2-diacylglycerol beta-glucosyltransferase
MRILIATVTAGAGHLAAAAALQEAWRCSRPDDLLERVDLVEFFSPLHRKIHADGYVQLVQHAPELWGMVFEKTDTPKAARRLARLRRLFPSQSCMRFARYVRRFRPDVVLCTHYEPIETLAGLRAEARKGPRTPRTWRKPRNAPVAVDPLIVSIVTDFEAHVLWMDSCVDLYCVAAEATKVRLVARGAAANDVLVTGIPISARFSAKTDPRAVRRQMGLRDDLPVLLVLSGGFGLGPVAQILEKLDRVERQLQTVVVTGRNEELRRELAAQDRRHPTHVLGFASNMHELMAAANLIITKPGGLTTSEVLAIGKPMLIINPIPGQEAANSDFLLERGVATKVNRVEDLPYRIEQLLGGQKLTTMAQAARRLGRPDAAQRICDAVAERLKCRANPGS